MTRRIERKSVPATIPGHHEARERPIKLTPEQIHGLQRLRRYRETPPTVRERLRQVAGTMMLMLLLVFLLGYLTLRLHAPVRPKVRSGYAIAIGATFFALTFGIAVAGERLLAYAYDPVRNNPPNHVIVLSASWCPYCMTLRHHLSGLNIPYTDLDTESTTEGRWAFRSLHGNGTPITIVGKQVIRGLGSATTPWSTVDDALKRAGYPLPTTTNTAY